MKKLSILSSLLVAGALNIAQAQTAKVQAIHNCPDPAAATVDVYLGATRILDDFNYKEASPYIDAPAGSFQTIYVCPSTSTDTTGFIFKQSFFFSANNDYTIVASGGLAETGNTAFDLREYSGLRSSNIAGLTSVNIIHGVYDAPAVDIYEVQVPAGLLVDSLPWSFESSYTDLPAADFDIQVRTQAGIVVKEFDVDISSFADSAITVLATGYLDPSSAVGTEPFGLIAVFPNGTVATLPSKAITPARLQVIHNCAATDAATVDVWLDDTKLLPDFEFRTASAFIDAPAGSLFDVSIAGPNSSDTAGALYKASGLMLESGMTYIVVASGTIGSGMYSPATPFSLEIIGMAQETSMDASKVDVIVWHGSTDAPTVDVVETLVGAGTIVDDISYGESQGYLALDPRDYALEIRDETGSTTVAKFYADINGLEGNALTILASGFLDPSMNNNGAAFGLWVATPMGGDLLELSNITGIEEQNNIVNFELFPNPAVNEVNVTLDAQESGITNVAIFNILGNVVWSQQLSLSKGANMINLDVSNLESGQYFFTMGENSISSAIQFVKQ